MYTISALIEQRSNSTVHTYDFILEDLKAVSMRYNVYRANKARGNY